MAFDIGNFNTPIYEENSEEPNRVVIISCEGCVTEPEYFRTIIEKCKNIIPLVEIEIVQKAGTASEPQHVLQNLKNHVDKYDYKKGYDTLWLVCDRESVPDRKAHLQEIYPECLQNGYSIALSNPTFELWLLLHIADISEYDKKELFENKKTGGKSSRRFIENELFKTLENGYNKRKGKFNKDIVSVDSINFAVQQSKQYKKDFNSLIDQLGTNVDELIRDLTS